MTRQERSSPEETGETYDRLAGSHDDAPTMWADTSGAHDSVSGFWADTSGSWAGAPAVPADVPDVPDVRCVPKGRADAFGGNLHAGYWTDEYDEASAGEATDRLTDLVAERLEVLPGDHVLDVGSGTGRPAVRIATARDVHVAGVTLSEYQVRLARSRPEAGEGVGQADFQLADAMWLPFEDDSFDAAYAIESLAHLENPSAALDEIARVLRPGGRFVVGEWYLLEPLPGEEAERFTRDFDVRFLPTADDLYRRMEQAGLKIEIFHDIWANISRSFGQVDDVLPASAAGPAGEAAERPTARREMYRRFGQIPQISYALFTAVRH